MSTPSNASSSEPGQATGSSQDRRSGFLPAIFRRFTEIYFFGGLALLVFGATMAADSGTHSSKAGNAFAGLGLCVAGGLCFVASAIIHSRE